MLFAIDWCEFYFNWSHLVLEIVPHWFYGIIQMMLIVRWDNATLRNIQINRIGYIIIKISEIQSKKGDQVTKMTIEM